MPHGSYSNVARQAKCAFFLEEPLSAAKMCDLPVIYNKLELIWGASAIFTNASSNLISSTLWNNLVLYV